MFYVIKPQTIEFSDMVIIEGVIDLPPVFAAADQLHLAQSAELMRDGRLAHLKLSRDITNVHLTGKQDRNNPQASWVAEGTE